MIRILALFAALICAAPAIAQPLPANLDKANAIVIDTSKGRIVIKLRADLAPQHAERIKQLAREGYYNNVPFHRVMDGFMAQTGDGEKFNGSGGSQYPNLKQKISKVPFTRGLVGMARARASRSPAARYHPGRVGKTSWLLETAALVAGEPDGHHGPGQLQPRRQHFGPPADHP